MLTLVLAGGMVMAGLWQYGRGTQKQSMQARQSAAVRAEAMDLALDSTLPARGASRRVTVMGEYRPELSVLLDNQPLRGAPGVHAWAVLELPDGRRVVVDRGWLPLGAPVLPPPTGPQRVEGQWRMLPRAGLRLGAASSACETPRPLAVTYPDQAQIHCLFGNSTLDGLLELSATAAGGFARDWASSGVNEIPPSRHFGYAAQWWLFAVTLIALFIKIHLKKKPLLP